MSDVPVTSWRIDEWFPDLDASSREALKRLHTEVLLSNKTENLVAPKTIALADIIHFADSILGSRAILGSGFKGKQIYDFASGAGFPGLVFATLAPSVKVSLVDADQKRCDFLRRVSQLMGLKNVEVINSAFEKLPDNSVHFAMIRGFSSISKTILLARKVMPKGGTLFHLKAENWPAEVGEIPTQLCSIWTPGLVQEYRLPIGTVRCGVVRTDKIA